VKARVYHGNNTTDFAATKNNFGGITIGCNVFSKTAARQLARWAGLNPITLGF
jgi:hypothetical protein